MERAPDVMLIPFTSVVSQWVIGSVARPVACRSSVAMGLGLFNGEAVPLPVRARGAEEPIAILKTSEA